MTRRDEATECVICDSELPEGRLLTCSHDCYIEYKYRREKDKRVADGKFGKRPNWCENCKKRFFPSYNPSHKETMHIMRYKPKYCSKECEKQFLVKNKELAAKVLRKFT